MHGTPIETRLSILRRVRITFPPTNASAFAHSNLPHETILSSLAQYLAAIYFTNANPFAFSARRSLGIELGPIPCSSRISSSLNLDNCRSVFMP
jgi:hypothetical protein